MIISLTFIIALSGLILSLFSLKDYFIPLELELTTNKDTIKYGEIFYPNKYIKLSNNGDIILPEVDTNQVGTYTLNYTIKNSVHKKSIDFDLTIIDDEKPVITLKQKEVYKDEFYKGCKEYIESGFDNVDNDITKNIICIDEDDRAIYTLKDSSNNSTTEFITFKDIPECDKNASWNGEACICNKGYTGDGYNCTYIKPNPTQHTKPDTKYREPTPTYTEHYYDSGWIYETIEPSNDGNAIIIWE